MWFHEHIVLADLQRDWFIPSEQFGYVRLMGIDNDAGMLNGTPATSMIREPRSHYIKCWKTILFQGPYAFVRWTAFRTVI